MKPGGSILLLKLTKLTNLTKPKLMKKMYDKYRAPDHNKPGEVLAYKSMFQNLIGKNNSEAGRCSCKWF